MPTLPTRDSRRQLTTQAPTAIQTGAGQEEAATGRMIGVAQQITQKWSAAVDTMQYTTAKANFEVGLAELKQRAKVDPNFNNSEAYFKEVAKLQKTSLQGFSNKLLEQRVSIEFNLGGRIANLEIDGIFKRKQLLNNQFQLDRGIEALVEKQVSAITPELSKKAREEMIALVQLNVLKGTITKAEGQKKIDDALISAVKFDIYNDMSTEETGSVVEELKKGKEGKYNYLDASERLKLIGEGQRRIAQNVQNMKAITVQQNKVLTEDMYDRLAEGTYSLRDIDKARKVSAEDGGIDSRLLNQIQKGLVSEFKNDVIEVSKTDAKAKRYIELISDFLDDKTDREKAYEILADLYSDRQISPEDMKVLRPLVNALEDIEYGRLRWKFARPIAGIKSFFRENVLTDEKGKPVSEEKGLALAIKRYLKEVAKGTDPDDAAKEIILEEQKAITPERSRYEIGEKISNPATGKSAEVTGYDEDGMPLLKLLN